MLLSTSPDQATAAPVSDAAPGRFAVSDRARRAVFAGGIVVTAALLLFGAWQRRWIADDGLIVLRTVRNLLAGNGPVFNAGERVEANTSTVWTYLVYAVAWLTNARLEYIVLTLALLLSVGAIVFAMLGSGRLWGGAASGLLLPAGAIVYIAVPPARDYATSGLESALVMCWLGLLWWLLMRWAGASEATGDDTGASEATGNDTGASEATGNDTVPETRPAALLTLGFVAGLGVLVRPELLLVSLLALALIFFAPIPRAMVLRPLLVFVSGVVPVGYQIWRMGYYGLPYPNTAVAKDAAGAKWGQGFAYLWNLVGPYLLWVPLLILLVAAVVVVRATPRVPRERSDGWRRWQSRLRSPAAVVTLILLSAFVLLVYSLRVGGDFMHGRMLLPVLFCLLAPVAVLPIRLPYGDPDNRWATPVALGAWVAVLIWSVLAANITGMGTTIGRSGIVDERAYYALNSGHAHPLLAEDYLDYGRMRAMVEAIENSPDGGLVLPTPSLMRWDVVPPPLPIPEGGAGHTVYFLNLGMTSMNVPLDVRVLDPMGLAYPLAAHTDRLTDGRIGHDKSLYADWVIADAGMVDRHPWMPWYFDEDWVSEADAALKCPAIQDLLTSYRSELTWERWLQNFKRSLEFAAFRFDRVPQYAIEQCGLEPPRISTDRAERGDCSIWKRVSFRFGNVACHCRELSERCGCQSHLSLW